MKKLKSRGESGQSFLEPLNMPFSMYKTKSPFSPFFSQGLHHPSCWQNVSEGLLVRNPTVNIKSLFNLTIRFHEQLNLAMINQLLTNTSLTHVNKPCLHSHLEVPQDQFNILDDQDRKLNYSYKCYMLHKHYLISQKVHSDVFISNLHYYS